VLLVGALESFLREAFAEHLESLVGPPPPVPFEKLPRKLRTSSAYESLELAMKGPRFGEPTERIHRLPGVMASARRLVAGVIDADALAETKGNPSSDRVRSMFRAIGAGNPFESERTTFEAEWGRAEASTFLADKLDEIVNARHVVAHTANALGITRADLVEWPRFVLVFAQIVDQRLDRFIGDVIDGVLLHSGY
jgi:hypothetical protein